jgi:hypothetical protein
MSSAATSENTKKTAKTKAEVSRMTRRMIKSVTLRPHDWGGFHGQYFIDSVIESFMGKNGIFPSFAPLCLRPRIQIRGFKSRGLEFSV